MLKRNLWLGAVAALLIIAPLLWYGSAHEFNGTDDQAQTLIEQIQPAYQPWFQSFFEPGARAEAWLFALQAVTGASVLGYCLWRLRARRQP